MGTYRNILVAYDGSESSKNALRQAVKLAKEVKGKIKAVSVVPLPEVEVELLTAGKVPDILKKPADDLLAEAAKIAQSEGVTLETEVKQGRIYEEIINAADAEGSDVIVIGRKGISRVERMLMGSVTARVLGHTDREVLVVPKDAELGWETILLATDGSEYSDAALKEAIEFTKAMKGTLNVVSVVNRSEEFYGEAPEIFEKMEKQTKAQIDSVLKKAESNGVTAVPVLKDGDASRKIVELADEAKVGVIFMGSHGRTGLKKVLMGSVTEKVIGLASCPVVVVKA